MQNETKINCPNCGHPIDVEDILAHRLEEELKKKFCGTISCRKEKIRR
jgi:endogenous inhibitor of DNA gyrase (YacG/DUF329 family)